MHGFESRRLRTKFWAQASTAEHTKAARVHRVIIRHKKMTWRPTSSSSTIGSKKHLGWSLFFFSPGGHVASPRNADELETQPYTIDPLDGSAMPPGPRGTSSLAFPATEVCKRCSSSSSCTRCCAGGVSVFNPAVLRSVQDDGEASGSEGEGSESDVHDSPASSRVGNGRGDASESDGETEKAGQGQGAVVEVSDTLPQGDDADSITTTEPENEHVQERQQTTSPSTTDAHRRWLNSIYNEGTLPENPEDELPSSPPPGNSHMRPDASERDARSGVRVCNQSEKEDAKSESQNEDTKMESDKEEAKSEREREDASSESENEDTKMESGKEEAKSEIGKEDSESESDKEEAQSESGKEEAKRERERRRRE